MSPQDFIGAYLESCNNTPPTDVVDDLVAEMLRQLPLFPQPAWMAWGGRSTPGVGSFAERDFRRRDEEQNAVMLSVRRLAPLLAEPERRIRAVDRVLFQMGYGRRIDSILRKFRQEGIRVIRLYNESEEERGKHPAVVQLASGVYVSSLPFAFIGAFVLRRSPDSTEITSSDHAFYSKLREAVDLEERLAKYSVEYGKTNQQEEKAG